MRTYLFLREVGNVTRHGSCDNQRAGLSLLEVMTDSLSAVQDASQVSVDDFFPVLDACVQDAGIGSATSVGNHDVDLAEILDDILNQLLYIGVVVDVALVWDALDAIFLGDILCVLLTSLGTGAVGDSNIGTEFRTATSSLGANASGTRSTGDNDDLALQAEEVVQAALGRQCNPSKILLRGRAEEQ